MTEERKKFWIDDVPKALRLYSVWLSGLFGTIAAVAAGVWQFLTAEEQNAILSRFGVDGIFRSVALAFIVVVIARLKNQTPPPPSCPPPSPTHPTEPTQ